MGEEKQVKKLGPQEIVLANARILVHSDLDKTKELLDTSFTYMKEQLNNKEDFRKDINALVGIQIQLASLSLAVEYWTAKLKQNRIQVYDQSAMPKS